MSETSPGSGERMKISRQWSRGQIAGALMILLAVPSAEGAAPQQQSVRGQQQQSLSPGHDQTQGSDGQARKPNSNTAQSARIYPDSPDPVRTQVAEQNGQSDTPDAGSEQKQNAAPKPVGTAAAPYEKTTGVSASRPAGAAIAPAKQRRARSILIRVGVVVGAAVAVGTVVALSHGSPSRPQ
jgi:hypothetical protein